MTSCVAAVAMAAFLSIQDPPAEAPKPDPLEQAFKQLQAAQAAKDPDGILKAAMAVSSEAQKVIASPAPSDETEKETWTRKVDYAKGMGEQVEYALYAAALETTQPAQQVALLAALEKQNPKAKYLGDAYGHYLYALSKAGQTAQIAAVAERGLAHFPSNADLLAVMADQAMAKQQKPQAATYADRLIAALGTAPKSPAAVTALTRAHWIAGVTKSELGQYPAADKHLRLVLPNLTDVNMKGAALFHLGLSNYQVGKATNNKAQMLEAAKFSDQCAALKSPFAQQAWKNAALIKQEAARLR